MNRREIGTAYEAMAAEYLEEQGYQIVEKNFRCGQGEIDLICREDGYLVFVEVKYRRTRRQGGAFMAVDVRKQRRISRVALFYFKKKRLRMDTKCRFDVVAIDGSGICLLKNAFDFCG